MKLFRVEVRFRRKRRDSYGVETVVHAQSPAAAEDPWRANTSAVTIVRIIELANAPKHFVIADLVD